jgi:hypothetical protein
LLKVLIFRPDNNSLKRLMKRNPVMILVFLVEILTSHNLNSQTDENSFFSINSRLSFYSFEKNGEFLLHLPVVLSQSNLSIIIKIDEDTVASWNGRPDMKILRIPFSINKMPSFYNTEAIITLKERPRIIYTATTKLIILAYKSNEVKTDRLTGGLIVNRLPFFPFGFYCYSPVNSSLPEEEVVKGFNMMSPYQKIMPETLNERKAYMDRCAQLGMKVNYNLLSVSGGGGVGSKTEGLSDEEKRLLLLNEIRTFRDHPALLCWYISDEPNGMKIAPEVLEEIYNTVKENDPWHPVSIVFMAPFISSKNYINTLDIVMADPYPVPDSPLTLPGDIAGQLKAEFNGKRPVWMAQQSFGGGELWSREPTIQEIRTMTYQSIIRGATGIQYFVRQGLNYFPKSAATWGECGRMAMEIAWLTPWLLSDEKTLPVESYSNNIIVTSRLHQGQLIIMAVNKINEPAGTVIRINGVNNSKARVLFENRSVTVSGGMISDQLSPYGSQVYLINLNPEKQEIASPYNNLIKDPGFEDISSPGIPSACYARPGGDRGATFFTDTRERFEGNSSVRLVTPEENKSAALRFFPIKLKAGASYVISIWAKSDPDQRFSTLTSLTPQYAEILLGEFVHSRFIPEKDWRRFITFVTIPADTTSSFKTNLILKMPGQGVAWFDQIKVYEEKTSEN